MIPINISITLFIFICLFIIGLIMATIVLVKSIKEKLFKLLIISAIIILFYMVFGLLLL